MTPTVPGSHIAGKLGLTDRIFAGARSRSLLKTVEAGLTRVDRALEQELRVWVAGCATGEEAYTFAILLFELMTELKKPLSLKIFATDLDLEAIERARVGVYGQASLGVAVSSTTPGISGFLRGDVRFGDKIEGYALNGGLRYQF